jgi:hypothetical protein
VLHEAVLFDLLIVHLVPSTEEAMATALVLRSKTE